MAKGEIANESIANNNGTNKHSFLVYVLCFHTAILYVIIFSLYYDMQQIQRTFHEFNANFINLTAKEVQLQTKFLQEFTLEACQSSARSKRNKREAPFANRSRFDVAGFSRKSPVTPNLDERSAGGPERKNSERRGKKNKKKNRRKRCNGFSPRASHFIGALPEPIIKDGGLLAPWLLENESVKDFGLVTNVPSRGRDSIEIAETGLYFIYAQQLYYMSTPEQSKAHHSFVIVLKPSSGPERQIAHCATLGDANLGSEASCFTGAAHTLIAGDLIYIKQRERDRHILMRPGNTFLGLVMLNKRERN